jgi:hypothetical protein
MQQSQSLIEVTEDIPTVAGKAWAALRAVSASDRPRFVRVGKTPCVRTDDGLEALEKPLLSYWLARVAIFYKVLKSGEKIVKPPQWLVADMLAAPVPDLPEEGRE